MNNLHLLGDIDIDTPDRNRLLQPLDHVCASAKRNGQTVKHNTGVYFHKVPQDPFRKWCSLSYEQAENQGCYKIDVLNNHIYAGVQSEAHLNHLMQTQPMWELLQHEEFVKELAHINGHVALVQQLKPRSIMQLAMLLALIRPGKRYLVPKCAQSGWHSLNPEIWTPDPSGYTFKKAHAVSLAVSIQVQMNLLVEQLTP